MTVAGCRNDDSSCGTGKKLAAKIVEEVTGEAPAEPKDKDIGKPLDIQFTATDGTKVDLTKMKGKVVLIDFWATWCGPCVREPPNVKKAYTKLHPKGLRLWVFLWIQMKEGWRSLLRIRKCHGRNILMV